MQKNWKQEQLSTKKMWKVGGVDHHIYNSYSPKHAFFSRESSERILSENHPCPLLHLIITKILIGLDHENNHTKIINFRRVFILRFFSMVPLSYHNPSFFLHKQQNYLQKSRQKTLPKTSSNTIEIKKKNKHYVYTYLRYRYHTQT